MTEASSADRDPVEQLAEEFLERRRRGETPALSEYIARHPELADQIRDLFPALTLLEKADPITADLDRSPAPLASASTVPTQLGDYRLLRELGRGGMGVVYEAEQLSLGRRVALKVVPPGALLQPRHLQRFEREAKAAARLHHTNIVPVYGVGCDAGVHYYAMQFIQGLPLNLVIDELRRLREGTAVNGPEAAAVARSLWTGTFARPAPVGTEGHEPATAPPVREESSSSVTLPGRSGDGKDSGHRAYWQAVARVGVQVADALAYAHGEGVLHRDVKPANLLLDGRGQVWVTDLGLAKSAGSADLTGTGDVVGTLRYMAPEQFEGRADARSDVCALGLTLYELLALRPAFDETERNRLIQQVSTAEPPALRRLNPEVPRDLAIIVHKAMERDPTHRYPTAAELRDDLQRCLNDEPIRARRLSALERCGRWCWRNPVVAGLLLAVLVSVLAGLAGVHWQWQRAEDRAKAEHEARLEVEHQKQTIDLVRDAEVAALGQLKKVNADLETTWARSLLRPLGTQAPRPDQQQVPLNDAEIAALHELADRRESLGYPFLGEALRGADTTRQLKHRAAYALHAIVGLEPKRRKRLEQFLLNHLRAGRMEESQKTELALVAAALGDLSPEAATTIGRILTHAMRKVNDPVTLRELAVGLALVAEQLQPQQITLYCDEAATTLSKAIAKNTLPENLEALAEGLATVALPYQMRAVAKAIATVEHLKLSGNSPECCTAAYDLAERIRETTDAAELEALVEGLGAVAVNLHSGRAEGSVAKG